MKKLMIALMVAGAFAAGCGEKGSGSGSGATGAEKIGIQACDDYVAKMEACMAKDLSVRASSEESLKKTRAAWKQGAESAKDPVSRDVIKLACESAVVSMPPSCK